MRVYIQNFKSKNLHKPEGLDWVRETHSAHFLPETWKEGQAPCVHCTRSHFHPSNHGSYFTPRLFRQPYNQSPCSHTWSLSVTSQGPSIIHSSAHLLLLVPVNARRLLPGWPFPSSPVSSFLTSFFCTFNINPLLQPCLQLCGSSTQHAT